MVVEGGFRVSGRWSLVSGCELADWIPVMCVITEGAEPRMLAAGVPEARMVYSAERFVSASWTHGMSVGLRGPAATMLWWMTSSFLRSGPFRSQTPVQSDRPLSRTPFFATVCASCAALCLGIAQAATDTLLELAASKVQVDPFPGLGIDRPSR